MLELVILTLMLVLLLLLPLLLLLVVGTVDDLHIRVDHEMMKLTMKLPRLGRFPVTVDNVVENTPSFSKMAFVNAYLLLWMRKLTHLDCWMVGC